MASLWCVLDSGRQEAALMCRQVRCKLQRDRRYVPQSLPSFLQYMDAYVARDLYCIMRIAVWFLDQVYCKKAAVVKSVPTFACADGVFAAMSAVSDGH